MTKQLRKIARWNLKTSARQMPNTEPSPIPGYITPPGVQPSFSIPYIESSDPDAPPTGTAPPPSGATPPPSSVTPPPYLLLRMLEC